MPRLRNFLTRKEVVARIVSNSSSCRAFCTTARRGQDEAHRCQVPLASKQGEIWRFGDGWSTVLNVADINTKKLTEASRSFLMYLIGVVEYDKASKGYVPAGEGEFNI